MGEPELDSWPFKELESVAVFVDAAHDALAELIRPVRDEQFTLFVPRDFNFLRGVHDTYYAALAWDWRWRTPLVVPPGPDAPVLGVRARSIGFQVETTTSLLVRHFTTAAEKSKCNYLMLLHRAVANFFGEHQIGVGDARVRMAMHDMFIRVLEIGPRQRYHLSPAADRLRRAVVALEDRERSAFLVNRMDKGVGPVREGKAVLTALMYKAGYSFEKTPNFLRNEEYFLSLFKPYGVTECVETS